MYFHGGKCQKLPKKCYLINLLLLMLISEVYGGKRCYKLNADKRTYKDGDKTCDLCLPGQFKVESCGNTLGTRCAECLDNTYMPYYNSCEDCWVCDNLCNGLNQIITQECNRTHERLCGCKEGTYPLASGDICIRYSCPAGQRVHVYGKVGTDLRCRPCPPFTYSSTTNSQVTCHRHANCTQLGKDYDWMGNATHDATCKDREPVTHESTVQQPKTTLSPSSVSYTTDINKDVSTSSFHGNRITPYPTASIVPSHHSTNQRIQVGTIVLFVAAGVLVVVGILVVLGTCVCRRKNPCKRRPSIPTCAKRRLSFQCLLRKNITLKPEKSSENLLDGISKGIRQRYHKRFLRNLPSPGLTDTEIEDVEYSERSLIEIVYKCLLHWKRKLSPDDFPLKELLESLGKYDRAHATQMYSKFCNCEGVTNISCTTT